MSSKLRSEQVLQLELPWESDAPPAASGPEAARAAADGEGSPRITLIQGGQVVIRPRALSREALEQLRRKHRGAPKPAGRFRAKTSRDDHGVVHSYQHAPNCLHKSKEEREGRCHACYLDSSPIGCQ